MTTFTHVPSVGRLSGRARLVPPVLRTAPLMVWATNVPVQEAAVKTVVFPEDRPVTPDGTPTSRSVTSGVPVEKISV
jgi:hypothetical protein